MQRTWKPTVAGIINIAVGVFIVGYNITVNIGEESLWGLIYIIFAIPPIASGVCALLRRVGWLALIGSILAFPPGLVSLILIILSYQEFRRPESMTR